MAHWYKRIGWLLLFLFLLPKSNLCEEFEAGSLEGDSDPAVREPQSQEDKPRSAFHSEDDDDEFVFIPSPPSPPEDFRTVELDQGLIKGKLETSTKGELFYSFYGIPYAKPPVDELRFKDPEPHEGWEGVRDATTMPPPCPQINVNKLVASGRSSYSGEEDCLFLNVFHPAELDGLSKAVMVFFHGGAFASGSAADYEPYDLMNEDVILVVLQFRLGILGFSSTEDLVMPGNLGLKDQTLALRWIQKNIEHFGGDSLKVALFGEGSGAVSIHFQILSHHSIGLFSRAIMQSGTALCPWAQGGVHRAAVERLTNTFKCNEDEQPSDASEDEEGAPSNEESKDSQEDSEESTTDESSSNEDNNESQEVNDEAASESDDISLNEEDDKDAKEAVEVEELRVKEDHEEKLRKSEKMLKCLQNAEVKKLAKAIKPFFALTFFPIIFGPMVDERFIPGTPDFLLKDARHKRLELIIGVTKDAGSFVTNSVFSSEAKRMLFKYEFPFAGPLSMEFTDNDVAPLNMSIKAFDRYVGGLKFDANDAMNLTKLYTDRHLTVCSDLSALLHSENNKKKKKNVFFYELHHKGGRSFNDIFDLSFGKEWISQGDELFYLFPMKTSEDEVEINEEDRKLKDIMVKMWANFAQTAHPTPDDSLGFSWEPFTPEAPNHLVLKPEPYMEEDSRKEIREFWTSLPTQQNLLLFKERIENLQEMRPASANTENQEVSEEERETSSPSQEESIDEAKKTEQIPDQEDRAEETIEKTAKLNDEL